MTYEEATLGLFGFAFALAIVGLSFQIPLFGRGDSKVAQDVAMVGRWLTIASIGAMLSILMICGIVIGANS